jgi:hypothetical protein
MMKAGITVNGSQLTLAMPIERVEDDNFFRTQYKRLKEKSSWPAPTPSGTKIKEYKLYFYKDLEDKFEFNWTDYSGELIEEESHLLPEAYKQLTDRLLTKEESSNSSILLSLKGEWFSKPVPDDEFELNAFMVEHDLGAFNSLMSKYIETRKSRKGIIVLLITMYDLCESRAFEDIIADIRRLFPSLFNGKCILGIIPVALGFGKLDAFKVAPFQVHLPLIFILQQELEIGFKLAEWIENEARTTIQVQIKSPWGDILNKLGLNAAVDKAKQQLEGMGEYKKFFSPYREFFKKAVMKGKLYYVGIDGVGHELGQTIRMKK